MLVSKYLLWRSLLAQPSYPHLFSSFLRPLAFWWYGGHFFFSMLTKKLFLFLLGAGRAIFEKVSVPVLLVIIKRLWEAELATYILHTMLDVPPYCRRTYISTTSWVLVFWIFIQFIYVIFIIFFVLFSSFWRDLPPHGDFSVHVVLVGGPFSTIWNASDSLILLAINPFQSLRSSCWDSSKLDSKLLQRSFGYIADNTFKTAIFSLSLVIHDSPWRRTKDIYNIQRFSVVDEASMSVISMRIWFLTRRSRVSIVITSLQYTAFEFKYKQRCSSVK